MQIIIQLCLVIKTKEKKNSYKWVKLETGNLSLCSNAIK